jgi:hypothetical protein
MSFGLRNAAQTFERFMDEILNNLDFCFACLDDILFFSLFPKSTTNIPVPSLPNSKPTASF